jgi:phage-related protein
MAAGPQGWQVDDWRGPGGARPVRDFINDLSKPAKAKVLAALQMLEEHGHRLQLPHSRALGGGLQELRIGHPEGPFRVIYCYLPGRKIVLLHAFVKRTEAIRKSDLDVARARKPTA